jgi:hypothetical protein
VSNRSLVIALASVSVAFAVTVGVWIGMSVGHGSTAALPAAKVSSVPTSAEPSSAGSTTPSPGQQSLTPVEEGVVSANLACWDLDAAGSYWVDFISVHAVDRGVTKPVGAEAGVIDTERAFIQQVHAALAAAAIHDGRWGALSSLVLRDEAAETALWDRGGTSGIDATNKAVGADEDIVHGDCQAAKGELQTTAQSRSVTPQVVLQIGGATTNQVYDWTTWSESTPS